MKGVIKGIVGLAALVSLPAAAAILEGKQAVVLEPTGLAASQSSVREKDQSRYMSDQVSSEASTTGQSPVQLAQAFPEGGRMLPPPPRGGPPPAPFPFAPPHMSREGGAPEMARTACEEKVHFKSALIGYYKSKLRLDGTQRDAWQKLEQAAAAGMEKLRAACDASPVNVDASRNMLEAIDLAVRRGSADVEFLIAIREPLRALYELLSPAQQRLLQPPVPARHAL